MVDRQFGLKWVESGEPVEWGSRGRIMFSCKSINDLLFDSQESVEVKATKERHLASGEINLLVTGNYDIEGIVLSDEPVKCHKKGEAEMGTLRAVYQFIGPESGLPFRAGLTVHAGVGTWSSLPHKFEKEAILSPGPMGFWEQFAYMTWPPRAWGVQVRTGYLDGEMINDVAIVKDRDICPIPLGSHPVSGGPGVMMAYFWIYTCEDLSLMEKFS